MYSLCDKDSPTFRTLEVIGVGVYKFHESLKCSLGEKTFQISTPAFNTQVDVQVYLLHR